MLEPCATSSSWYWSHSWCTVDAQQLPQLTQYQFNDYVVNPAVAGSRPFFETPERTPLPMGGHTRCTPYIHLQRLQSSGREDGGGRIHLH